MELEAAKDKANTLSEKVEEMGVILEKSGYAPVPGRIMSYLLISEPPYRDFYEIQDFLKASKSSVSTTLKQLIQQGVVCYITFSGDRRRYFQIDTKGLLHVIKAQYKEARVINDMVREILDHRKDSEFQKFNRELKEVTDFSTYIHAGIEKLIREWEAEKR